jgi:hypothetical protein
MAYTLGDPKRLIIDHEMGLTHQKNWMPFSYNLDSILEVNKSAAETVGYRTFKANESLSQTHLNLMFVYSIVPHRIVTFNETSDLAENSVKAHTVSLTEIRGFIDTRLDVNPNASESEVNLLPLDWFKWGIPHGGTPCVLTDTPFGPRYLTIFHSMAKALHPAIKTYFMGAYLFEPHPPFRITHFSSEPIVPKPFYDENVNGWAFKAIDYIVFPMGLVIRGDYIYISLGKNDKFAWETKFKKTPFLLSLKPVYSAVLLDRFSEL